MAERDKERDKREKEREVETKGQRDGEGERKGGREGGQGSTQRELSCYQARAVLFLVVVEQVYQYRERVRVECVPPTPCVEFSHM